MTESPIKSRMSGLFLQPALCSQNLVLLFYKNIIVLPFSDKICHNNTQLQYYCDISKSNVQNIPQLHHSMGQNVPLEHMQILFL